MRRSSSQNNSRNSSRNNGWNNSRNNSRNNGRMKYYMEAGLALLLVLTIGLAGRTGLLAQEPGLSGTGAAAGQETGNSADLSTDSSADPGEASGAGQESGGSGNSDSAAEQQSSTARYLIMGESSVTVQDMEDYFNASGEEYPAEELAEGGAGSIETFCQMYYEEATAEGVKPEVAFAQTMKETGFLQYGGDASIEQFNFAGIGTTGNGVPGNSYPDVRTGIRAQIQHLKAYATADPLEQECVDDRYELVKKGSAPYVEWLGQQENPQGAGWATGENYGYDIVGMIEDMTEP